MPKRNVLLAMFDVRPKRLSADLVLEQIKKELDLRKQNRTNIKPNNPEPEPVAAKTIIEQPNPLPSDYWEELVSKLPQRPDFPFKYEL